jgi:hypothetical protein
MFLMNPDEQRQLLAASAATPASGGSPPAGTAPVVQNHANAKRRKTGFHHAKPAARAVLGRSVARFILGL